MIILDCNIMIDILNRKIIKKIGFKLTEFVIYTESPCQQTPPQRSQTDLII